MRDTAAVPSLATLSLNDAIAGRHTTAPTATILDEFGLLPDGTDPLAELLKRVHRDTATMTPREAALEYCSLVAKISRVSNSVTTNTNIFKVIASWMGIPTAGETTSDPTRDFPEAWNGVGQAPQGVVTTTPEASRIQRLSLARWCKPLHSPTEAGNVVAAALRAADLRKVYWIAERVTDYTEFTRSLLYATIRANREDQWGPIFQRLPGNPVAQLSQHSMGFLCNRVATEGGVTAVREFIATFHLGPDDLQQLACDAASYGKIDNTMFVVNHVIQSLGLQDNLVRTVIVDSIGSMVIDMTSEVVTNPPPFAALIELARRIPDEYKPEIVSTALGALQTAERMTAFMEVMRPNGVALMTQGRRARIVREIADIAITHNGTDGESLGEAVSCGLAFYHGLQPDQPPDEQSPIAMFQASGLMRDLARDPTYMYRVRYLMQVLGDVPGFHLDALQRGMSGLLLGPPLPHDDFAEITLAVMEFSQRTRETCLKHLQVRPNQPGGGLVTPKPGTVVSRVFMPMRLVWIYAFVDGRLPNITARQLRSVLQAWMTHPPVASPHDGDGGYGQFDEPAQFYEDSAQHFRMLLNPQYEGRVTTERLANAVQAYIVVWHEAAANATAAAAAQS